MKKLAILGLGHIGKYVLDKLSIDESIQVNGFDLSNGYDLNNPVEYMNKIYKILSLGMSGESINVEDEVVKEIVNESNEESSIMETVD